MSQSKLQLQFINLVNKIIIEKQLTFGEEQYSLKNFESSEFSKFLNSFSKKDFDTIKSILINSKNTNKITLILETLYFHSKYNYSKESLLAEVKRIEKGYFPKFTYSDKTYKFCEETYFGFLRALKTNTLYTTKVKINNKIKRVFIKSPIGRLSKVDIGYHRLMIDPETFKIYTFRTDSNGKIIPESIKPPIVDLRNKGVVDSRYLELEDFKKQFKTQMIEYLDKTYGLDNLIKTFSLFDGKTNLERLEEAKEVIFGYIEKKYGDIKAAETISKLVNSILSQYPDKTEREFIREYIELIVKDHYIKTKGKDQTEALFKKTIFDKSHIELKKSSLKIKPQRPK